MPPDPDEPRPELEQLRRWFEARGGSLGALLDSDGAASLGGPRERASGGDDASGGREAGRWLKVGFALSLATVVLTTGLLLGHVWGGRLAVDRPASAPVAPPATRVVTRTVTPAPCLAALGQSDVVIRLFRGDTRDPRIAAAVKAFQRSRDDCRRQTAGR